MDPAQFTRLPPIIMADRLGTYLASVGGDPARAVRLYTWNIEVSAAFWGPLQAVEVVLRNALHQQMHALFAREDWWNDPLVALHHDQQQQVAKTLAKLAKRKPGFGSGHVVAELTLGFWTGLLGRGTGYEHRLWTPALRRAFPGYRGSRANLHAVVESLRLLRNRVAHHESIFSRHLAADHESILALAGHIDADARTWIDSHSRVPTVLARRHRCVDLGYATSF